MSARRLRDARLLTATVDVDALPLYRQIHGLTAPPDHRPDALDPAWERGVPRFLDLFREFGVRATFFVVTADLAHPGVRAQAAAILADGHELASHSHTHPYRLVRLPFAAQREELERADAVLRELTGRPVAGYRAPGYNQHPQIQAALARMGYLYDASAFPCPAYVLAKALIIAAKRFGGHESRSIVTRPWAAFGNRHPHEIATPHGPLQAIPITVLPPLRLPLIGTALFALGQTAVGWLKPFLAREALVHPEFHAVDLMSLEEDGLWPDLRVQPDLRLPLAQKRAILRRFFAACQDGGRVSATLAELARARRA
jgi:peptidoglycan-N-acetylglucosamine deacetylase